MNTIESLVKPSAITCELLQLIFIALKLCNLVDWPWTTVFMPTWVPIVTIAVFMACVGILLATLPDK